MIIVNLSGYNVGLEPLSHGHNIPLQQQITAEAHESNCSSQNRYKWANMAIIGSIIGQNDPRNINSKYMYQKWRKIGQTFRKKMTKIILNGHFWDPKWSK